VNLNNVVSSLLGLVFILVFFGLVMIFAITGRKRPVRNFREIRAYSRLRRLAGLTVEAGSRLHVSLGRGGLIGDKAGVALAGLTVLERVARAASVSDRPPVATSGEGMLSILSQDGLQNAYRAVNAENRFNPEAGRLTGLTPLSFAAGVMTTLKDEQVSTNVFIGNFGSEVALMTEAAERAGGQVIAGSDQPAAQAVLFATATEPLLGEEVYAGGAYLGGPPAHAASLRAQDALRWVIILAILVGSLLKLVGLL
jgi:hypothetical protein